MENNNRPFIFNRRKRYKTFGIMVKAKLEKLGENQTWLSEQMGVSRQILSSYLRGICKPTKDPAMKLCRVLSLDYEYVQEILNIKFITRNYNRSQA
jgi:transcriptional regulator with XRE-family HTH domain